MIGGVVGLVAVVFVIALIGGIWQSAKRSDQAAVDIEAGRLTVKPLGGMRVWCMSSGTDVPLASVDSIAVVDRADNGGRYWRPSGLGGPRTNLPGVLIAGIYRWRGVKELWMVGRTDKAVAITMHDERFTRVVVQVDDPDSKVAELNSKLPSALT